MTTIAERVARGAALLDQHMPGWENKVNLNILDIGLMDDCILGQCYGRYWDGARALKVFGRSSASLGFDAGDNKGDYELLTEAWAQLIEARREAKP